MRRHLSRGPSAYRCSRSVDVTCIANQSGRLRFDRGPFHRDSFVGPEICNSSGSGALRPEIAKVAESRAPSSLDRLPTTDVDPRVFLSQTPDRQFTSDGSDPNAASFWSFQCRFPSTSFQPRPRPSYWQAKAVAGPCKRKIGSP